MAGKSKAHKPKEPETKPAATTASPSAPPPRTLHERSQHRFGESRPFEKTRAEVGLSGLSAADQAAWISTRFLSNAPAVRKLSAKAQRDLWRHVNEASLPLRAAVAAGGGTSRHAPPAAEAWGRDAKGRAVGEYTPEEFERRTALRVRLTALEVAHRAWLDKRERVVRDKAPSTREGEESREISEDELEEERQRRKEMAMLNAELYGRRTGKYAFNPTWDDVEAIPQNDPEEALVAIAYPENYAEATSYLRAVMANKEYSPRCLRLTEDIISQNPAHYTVWLYRFSIINALDLSVPDEIEWLNEVSLEHLKNYQIWHHRQLLMDKYCPSIASSPDKVAALARAETEFMAQMFAEDTKNYHVWSYRQYLVKKLGLWPSTNPGAAELAAVEAMIEDDVRNNSAWSHRFYLVFSDPAHSTPGSHSTAHDPAVPADIVDREVRYAEEKIKLAPQNQSPWNYLKGVLAKGGKKLSSVEDFVSQFVTNIGKEDGSEDVKSSHALDVLAEIYAEKGDKEKADVCLRRLAEKWDRIRAGYWAWRRKALA